MNQSPCSTVLANVSGVNSNAAAPTGSAEVVIRREEYRRERDSNMNGCCVEDLVANDGEWLASASRLQGRLDKIGLQRYVFQD